MLMNDTKDLRSNWTTVHFIDSIWRINNYGGDGEKGKSAIQEIIELSQHDRLRVDRDVRPRGLLVEGENIMEMMTLGDGLYETRDGNGTVISKGLAEHIDDFITTTGSPLMVPNDDKWLLDAETTTPEAPRDSNFHRQQQVDIESVRGKSMQEWSNRE